MASDGAFFGERRREEVEAVGLSRPPCHAATEEDLTTASHGSPEPGRSQVQIPDIGRSPRHGKRKPRPEVRPGGVHRRSRDRGLKPNLNYFLTCFRGQRQHGNTRQSRSRTDESRTGNPPLSFRLCRIRSRAADPPGPPVTEGHQRVWAKVAAPKQPWPPTGLPEPFLAGHTEENPRSQGEGARPQSIGPIASGQPSGRMRRGGAPSPKADRRRPALQLKWRRPR